MSEPLPDAGWSREVVTIRNAVICPPTETGMQPSCGVRSMDGDCLHASTWRGGVRLTKAPPMPSRAVTRLPGRHMWGGLFYGHFGHFMTETMSRCWAFDQGGIDSIIFVPKHDKLTDFAAYRSDALDLLGIRAKPVVAREPVEVEELVVPGQGFGLGRIARGTPEFRDTMRRLSANLPDDPPCRIYISRTRFQGRGGIIAEVAVEQNMARNGYRVIHPERMALIDQLRAYKSATHVVGVDSSAFHIAGMVADPAKRFAFILRRDNDAYGSIAAQIEGMTGRPPHVIRALVANWMEKAQIKSNHLSWGEIDHHLLAQDLQAHGFIGDASRWQAPTQDQIDASIAWADSRFDGPALVRTPVAASPDAGDPLTPHPGPAHE